MKSKMAANATTQETETSVHEVDESIQLYMIVPYAGKQGEKIMTKIVKKMPETVRPKIVYNGTKLSTFFSAKDKVQKEHSSNIMCFYQYKHDDVTTNIGGMKCRFDNCF